MEALINPILQGVFGSSCNLISQNIITDGYKNATYRVLCSEHDIPLFIKIEKPFAIPRTQLFQIKKKLWE